MELIRQKKTNVEPKLVRNLFLPVVVSPFSSSLVAVLLSELVDRNYATTDDVENGKPHLDRGHLSNCGEFVREVFL